MSGDRVPLSRSPARISAFVAIRTTGIAALDWPPAGKSYQETSPDADAASLDAFRHIEAASLTK